MARVIEPAHRAPMVEIVLLLCTALAFGALLAAVPIEMDEERRDERQRREASPPGLSPPIVPRSGR